MLVTVIPRHIQRLLAQRMHDPKAIIVLGPRQVGKTTLIQTIAAEIPNVLWLTGDDPDTKALLDGATSTRLKALLEGRGLLVIDEAQRIPDIGLKIKLITDHVPGTKVIATGSSSLELAHHTREALTGRKWEYRMLPLSYSELALHFGRLEERRMLLHRLVYGAYPEVVVHPGNAEDVLIQLADSYLFKDILWLESIKRPDALVRLVQAIAYQLGNEVSLNELSRTTGIDVKTVDKYLSILEQAFVIFRMGSFSRNLRSELNQARKIYFYDNGIRNAVIRQFQPFGNRQDVGSLWENFLMAERQKMKAYGQLRANSWFWRTHRQVELDLLEESDGLLQAFEFKWNSAQKVKLPKAFAEAYPDATFQVVHPDNFEEFLGLA
jgi:uncharacterized protein